MKLPSGREISTESLADVVEMLARKSFNLENDDEADEEIAESLEDSCFSLSSTELPFSNDDAMAVVSFVKPIAEDISGALAAKMDEYILLIRGMVEGKLGPGLPKPVCPKCGQEISFLNVYWPATVVGMAEIVDDGLSVEFQDDTNSLKEIVHRGEEDYHCPVCGAELFKAGEEDIVAGFLKSRGAQ